jgi:hypothetical protein
MAQATRRSDADGALLDALLEGLDRVEPILEGIREVLLAGDRDQALELAVSISRLEYIVADIRDEVDAITDAVGA